MRERLSRFYRNPSFFVDNFKLILCLLLGVLAVWIGPPRAEADPIGQSLNKSGSFSAYTCRPCETGRHPFITADGTDLRKVDYCVVANNYLKFNTAIEIESVGTCLVKDRMGRGGRGKFDICFGNDLKLAKRFGVKRLKYRVVARR